MLSSETRTWQENFAQRLKISKHISNQNRNHQARRFWNLKSLKFNKIKSPVHPGNSLLLLPRDFEVRQIQFQIRHMVTGLHPLWNVCLATSIHRWHHDASFQENYDWEIWWHPKLIQLRSFKHYKADSRGGSWAKAEHQLVASDKIHLGEDQESIGRGGFQRWIFSHYTAQSKCFWFLSEN